MNATTLNSFYQTLKQSSDNHKPHRHRKSHSTDEEVLFRMKMKMAQNKARNKHKQVIAKARLARNNYECLDTMNMGDACVVDLFDFDLFD